MREDAPIAAGRLPSAEWPAAREPAVSVVIPTHDRAGFLDELIAALVAQTLPMGRFEVVVVDDGSSDDTWERLAAIAGRTPLALLAVRVSPNRGPAEARNTGAAYAGAPVVAFTDDDCLPTTGWLEAVLAAVEAGSDLVQGRTIPDPEAFRRSRPWDRTVWVTGRTPLFETCNIAYRRDRFLALGGFAHERPGAVGGTRHHFGEDAELGWRLVAAGGTVSFAPEALVHHRMLPSDYAGWLREQRRLALFPQLLRRTPAMRGARWGGIFLAPQTAAFDAGVAVTLAAIATRRPWLLVGWLPWIRLRWPAARRRRGRNPLVRLAQLGVGDAVGLASLIEGSARARRVVL